MMGINLVFCKIYWYLSMLRKTYNDHGTLMIINKSKQ